MIALYVTRYFRRLYYCDIDRTAHWQELLTLITIVQRPLLVIMNTTTKCILNFIYYIVRVEILNALFGLQSTENSFVIHCSSTRTNDITHMVIIKKTKQQTLSKLVVMWTDKTLERFYIMKNRQKVGNKGAYWIKNDRDK